MPVELVSATHWGLRPLFAAAGQHRPIVLQLVSAHGEYLTVAASTKALPDPAQTLPLSAERDSAARFRELNVCGGASDAAQFTLVLPADTAAGTIPVVLSAVGCSLAVLAHQDAGLVASTDKQVPSLVNLRVDAASLRVSLSAFIQDPVATPKSVSARWFSRLLLNDDPPRNWELFTPRIGERGDDAKTAVAQSVLALGGVLVDVGAMGGSAEDRLLTVLRYNPATGNAVLRRPDKKFMLVEGSGMAWADRAPESDSQFPKLLFQDGSGGNVTVAIARGSGERRRFWNAAQSSWTPLLVSGTFEVDRCTVEAALTLSEQDNQQKGQNQIWQSAFNGYRARQGQGYSDSAPRKMVSKDEKQDVKDPPENLPLPADGEKVASDITSEVLNKSISAGASLPISTPLPTAVADASSHLGSPDQAAPSKSKKKRDKKKKKKKTAPAVAAAPAPKSAEAAPQASKKKETEKEKIPKKDSKPAAADDKSASNDSSSTARNSAAPSSGSSVSCFGCGQAITSSYTTACGKSYHHSCFRCTLCKTPFAQGTTSFRTTVQGGTDAVCNGCYASKIAPRCARCSLPIIGTVTTAMNQVWHHECLTCMGCGQPVTQKFYLYANKPNEPWCSVCAAGDVPQMQGMGGPGRARLGSSKPPGASLQDSSGQGLSSAGGRARLPVGF